MTRILVLGRSLCDYMQDDVYHGLRTILGQDGLESNVSLEYLYQDFPEERVAGMYGRGFSYARNLDPNLRNVVPSEGVLLERVMTLGYYDAVLYLSIRRCQQLFKTIMQVFKGPVGVIDGEDDVELFGMPHGCICFKRELILGVGGKGLYPISFAIPEEKLTNAICDKTTNIANQDPGIAYVRKYIYTCEDDYYKGYQESRFGLTRKKAGWDCKRHYEIMANKCVPIFENIADCPEGTLTTLPKKMLQTIEREWQTASDEQYDCWQREIFEYTKEHLTTKVLGKYVLDRLLNPEPKEYISIPSARKRDVDLVVNCYEKTYREVLSKPFWDRLHNDSFGYQFAGRYVLINNVNDLGEAISLAAKLVEDHVIDGFNLVEQHLEDALRSVGLTKEELGPTRYFTDCALVALNLRPETPWLLYWDADVEIDSSKTCDWVTACRDIMEKEPRILVGNPLWGPISWDSVQGEFSEGITEDGVFGLGYGFADQLFLAKKCELLDPRIYDVDANMCVASLRYPMAHIHWVFEQAVDAYMRRYGRFRAQYLRAHYSHGGNPGASHLSPTNEQLETKKLHKQLMDISLSNPRVFQSDPCWWWEKKKY